jgi:hypothetical protein
MATETVTIERERINLLSESNHEISKLAEAMVRLLEIRRDDDFLMYHGILARIQQLSEMQFFALRLHGDGPDNEVEEHGPLANFRNMERLFNGMLPL